ncbi:YeeE/YedE family protein [Roseisalinus antarcticus]|uniref:Uncharacterized protein n=1 Tax=Roseisalinus antarcticus TaxID=254357 RepID=A0A1Y5RM82_9RHOB|nr:YeeE/YedE thiosulfate transporter family protein [Roseisalinus antarcticus]SLN19753.1 hypothetical protein ROA7023_00483 [Roseisalinus antarcticus]
MQMEWIWGLLGGGLIGSAGALYLLINGRVMGASGIVGGLVDGSATGVQRRERLAFAAGLFLVPAVLALLFGNGETHASANLMVMAAGGLLVGVGTRIANGCTSGHGVCGISRLSLRGIVATVFYIGAGGITVVLFRHLLGVI